MKLLIDLDMTPRRRRMLLGAVVPLLVIAGGTVAYAQTTTSAATLNDALIGTALNTLGQAVGALQVQVAALLSADHMARATLTSSGGIAVETGSWIKQVSHPTTGRYVVMFAPTAFTQPPTCVTTPNTADTPPPLLQCFGVTPTSVTCQASSAGSPVDTGLSLICEGI
jgi:hypothetical protein